MGVEIQGLNKLIRGLVQSGVEVQDLKEAFGSIASKGADLAAGYAPSRSGRLRATIRGNKAKNKAVVKAGGARVRYAGAINYGWRRRNIRPQLFMQRADNALRPQIVPLIEQELGKIIARNL